MLSEKIGSGGPRYHSHRPLITSSATRKYYQAYVGVGYLRTVICLPYEIYGCGQTTSKPLHDLSHHSPTLLIHFVWVTRHLNKLGAEKNLSFSYPFSSVFMKIKSKATMKTAATANTHGTITTTDTATTTIPLPIPQSLPPLFFLLYISFSLPTTCRSHSHVLSGRAVRLWWAGQGSCLQRCIDLMIVLFACGSPTYGLSFQHIIKFSHTLHSSKNSLIHSLHPPFLLCSGLFLPPPFTFSPTFMLNPLSPPFLVSCLPLSSFHPIAILSSVYTPPSLPYHHPIGTLSCLPFTIVHSLTIGVSLFTYQPGKA